MIYMPHWPKPLGSRPKDFSLDRIKSFLNKLDNPEKKNASRNLYSWD